MDHGDRAAQPAVAPGGSPGPLRRHAGCDQMLQARDAGDIALTPTRGRVVELDIMA
jgi:hypothetical protein